MSEVNERDGTHNMKTKAITIHEENLIKARKYLSAYKEKHPTKLCQGVHLRYFTKAELIKILDMSFEKLCGAKKGE